MKNNLKKNKILNCSHFASPPFLIQQRIHLFNHQAILILNRIRIRNLLIIFRLCLNQNILFPQELDFTLIKIPKDHILVPLVGDGPLIDEKLIQQDLNLAEGQGRLAIKHVDHLVLVGDCSQYQKQ